ncbi:unnamed protein product, partial [Rotaria sp. Silwood1]
TKGDSTFVGELFDFDIIQHTDERQDEAINIRHRVLRCPTLGCSRIKAFTNRKALYEHIETTKQKPFIVNLVTKSAPVVGRFIGKNGVNLKQFQQANNVHLKILSKTTTISLMQNSNVQVQVKLLKANVNADDVSKKLRLLWEKADREQKNEEENFKRLQRTWIQKQSSTTSDIDFDSDMELDGDTRHARAFTISGDELIRRRSTRYEKKEATLGRRQARSILSLEGHRCAATQDRQQGGTKSVMFHQKKKTNMKDKQWMVKEQLDDMPLDVDDE